MEKMTIPFIVKNEIITPKIGQYNGYVAVSPKSVFHGHTYHDSLVGDLDVHGGITFSEPIINGGYSATSHYEIMKEFVGKRNPVAENAIRLDGSKEPIPDDWWILGFDTMHCGDNPKKWNNTSVCHEVYHLEKQILHVWDTIIMNAKKKSKKD